MAFRKWTKPNKRSSSRVRKIARGRFQVTSAVVRSRVMLFSQDDDFRIDIIRPHSNGAMLTRLLLELTNLGGPSAPK